MKYSNKVGENEYEINIRGIIGIDVSGKLIADEIEYLNNQGAKKIIERINSAGGDIIDGFNIVSANLQSETTIETINEGVAGSMAAIILASGDTGHRKALDYSTALIHDPQMSGETIETIADENQKTNLTKIKNSLVKILKDACNQPENLISKLMTRETVFSAAEQKEFGLVDKIIKSRIKAPQTANLSLLEIMNVCSDLKPFNNNNSKRKKMDELTNFLKLNNDATEKNILAAVKAIKDENAEAKKSFTNVTNELAQSKADLKIANESLKAFQDQKIANAVNNAITSGKFTDDQRQKLTEQATVNLDLFNTMVEIMPVIHKKSVMDELKNKGKKGENDEVKDWEYYQKNDPNFLKNLELTNVAEYTKLYEAYWEEKYEPVKK